VQPWDRGYWQPEGRLSPQRQLEKGELKFTLDGERLHGGFVLVRMRHDRDGGKRTNWLLIKHRDAYAVQNDGDAVLKADSSAARSAGREGRRRSPRHGAAELLERLSKALARDLEYPLPDRAPSHRPASTSEKSS
jgi:bifunctional non-homologous end joining protein LigD